MSGGDRQDPCQQRRRRPAIFILGYIRTTATGSHRYDEELRKLIKRHSETDLLSLHDGNAGRWSLARKNGSLVLETAH